MAMVIFSALFFRHLAPSYTRDPGSSSDVSSIQDPVNKSSNMVCSKASRIQLKPRLVSHYPSGARIIVTLTSETYQAPPIWYRWFKTPLPESLVLDSPALLLGASSNSRASWCFPGSEGHFAVHLSEPTLITKIILQAPQGFSPEKRRFFPRTVQIWGLIDGRENMEKVRNLSLLQGAHRNQAPLPGFRPSLLLTETTYNFHTENEGFDTPSLFRELSLSFKMLVAMIRSNWGESDYTCIHRFEVYGLPS